MDYRPPQYVIDEWKRQCHCCPLCNQPIPCDGVAAGGLCDDLCDCDDLDEQDEEY